MVYMLPSKKALMLFLRRKRRREYRSKSVQDSFEKPERISKRKSDLKKIVLIIILVPAVYYFHVFLFTYEARRSAGADDDKIEIFVDDTALLNSYGLQTLNPLVQNVDFNNQQILTDTVDEPPILPLCEVDVQNYTSGSSEILTVNDTKILVSLDRIYPMVQQGGYYKPPDCRTEDIVAIIVPYRNRSQQLTTFLYNIHPFLMNQKIEYRIFVIEQYGINKFNKGRLLNAGFREALRYGRWRCVVFHDVDLIPMSPLIRYGCPRHPRHMSAVVVDKGSVRNVSSPILFGGVTALSVQHYLAANGHSNMYWGWGGEDYDMFLRLRASGLPVVRYNDSIARYYALPHDKEHENRARHRLLRTATQRIYEDGLSSLAYEVLVVKVRHLYTQITVAVTPYNPSDCFRKKWLEMNKRSKYVLV